MIVQGFPLQDALRFWVANDVSAGGDGTLSLGGQTVAVKPAKPLTFKRNTIGHLYEFDSLKPDTQYEFSLAGSDRPSVAKTLPNSLSATEDLNFSFGSCYWMPADRGRLARSYPPKIASPRFRFLVGDQIYLDYPQPRSLWEHLGGLFGLGPKIPPEFPPQVLTQYKTQWGNKDFQTWLAATPTGVLADDHEFWNDYPNSNAHEGWSYPSKNQKIATEARLAFMAYQAGLNPGSEYSYKFSIDPVQFYVVDSRVERLRYDNSPPRLFNSATFGLLKNWLSTLKGPGVLALASLIVDEPPSWAKRATATFGDAPLPLYVPDYEELWDALINAPHDVLVLGGDVHYGRFGAITVGKGPSNGSTRKGVVYECISSSLAVLDAAKAAEDEYDRRSLKFNSCGILDRKNFLEYKRLDPGLSNTENYSVIGLRKTSSGVNLTIRFFDVNRGSTLWDSAANNLTFTLS